MLSHDMSNITVHASTTIYEDTHCIILILSQCIQINFMRTDKYTLYMYIACVYVFDKFPS